MKTVAVIPIKFNNKRLPGKNIRPLCGQPLITYMQKTLLNVSGIDEIYVYCSDKNVCNYLLDGVKFLQRSERLDGDTINANDIFTSFAEEIKADVYVVAHVTAPFIKAENIEKGIAAVKSGDYDSAFSVTKMQDFLWVNGKPINYDPNNIPRTQDLTPIYKETFAFFVFTDEVIKTYKRRIGNNPCLIEVDSFESVDIDELEDFEFAEALLSYFGEKIWK